jgi:hypothetical protein
MKTRTHFWAEAVYSEIGCTIPKHIRRGFETKKPKIANIVGEILREVGYCRHVQHPQPPVHVYGLEVDQLRAREKTLYENASKLSKPYIKDGVEFKRRQQKSEPILLIAVASYPEPSMFRTNERDKWERRVIRLAKVRWGIKFQGAYAHVDENYYHLHLWIDNNGRPVKDFHYGHLYANEKKRRDPAVDRATLAIAYKVGVTECQDWVHERLGKHMGWARKSEAPRPRMARGEAARLRQRKLEEAEELAEVQKAKNLRDTNAIAAVAKLTADEREAWKAEKKQEKENVREMMTKLHKIASVITAQATLEESLRGLGLDCDLLRKTFEP